MARKDDDIFRKLDKQKPLVKRKDLQPLSSGDFSSRNVPRTAQTLSYSPSTKKPAARKPAARGTELGSRYNQKQASSVPSQGLTVFGEEESNRPVRQPAKNAAASPRASVKSPETKPRVRDSYSTRVESKAQTRPEPATKQNVNARPHKEAAADLEIFTGHTNLPTPRDRSYGQSVQGHRPPAKETETAPDVAAKELTFRHEMKYYINYHDYVLLKNTLKPLLTLDRNAGEDGDYHIRSLYFDDAYETALAEKMAGSDIRSKFRIRIYDFSDNIIKFEKKYKQGQYIAKSSLTVMRDECEALIAGDCSCLEGRSEPLAEEIFLQMKNNLLRPRVIVDYHREAYVSPFENVRITFDKDLKAGLWLTDIFNPHAPTMPVLESGTMVLEVKFNRYLPVFIQTVLNNVNAAQRSAVSKYVLCRKYE